MRPLWLKGKNIGGYPVLDLDFRGINSVGIFGPTGAGKSYVPRAELLALTGENQSADPVGHIRKGSDLCQVEFGFEHAGSTYRIIHTDSLKSAKKKTDRQFQVSDGNGGWTPISGKGLAETDAAIVRAIGMGFNELVMGPFAIQEKAGLFLEPGRIRIDGRDLSGKSARLEITKKLAGLSHYEQWRVMAAAEARDLDAKAGVLEAQVAVSDGELVRREQVSADLAASEAGIQEARVGAQAAQDSKSILEAEAQGLSIQIEATRAQTASLEADRKALAESGATLTGKQGKREGYRRLLERRQEIEAQATQAAGLDVFIAEQRQALSGIAAEGKGIAENVKAAEGRISEADGKVGTARGKLADARKKVESRPILERKVSRLVEARSERQGCATRIQAADTSITDQQAELDAVSRANQEATKRRGEILAEEKRVTAEKQGLVPLIAGHELRTSVMETVPCMGVDDLPERCPLLKDARASVGPLNELREKQKRLCAWVKPVLPELQSTTLMDATLKTLLVTKATAQRQAESLDKEIQGLRACRGRVGVARHRRRHHPGPGGRRPSGAEGTRRGGRQIGRHTGGPDGCKGTVHRAASRDQSQRG